MRVGVLGHVVPLLFGYDATHDAGSQPDHFDYEGSHKAQGPAFLGLGIQRSNMQVHLLLTRPVIDITDARWGYDSSRRLGPPTCPVVCLKPALHPPQVV